MRRAILPLTLAGLGVGATVWFFMWVFEGQRDDVAIARAFLTHLAEGEHAAATELLSPLLQQQFSSANLNIRLGDIETWDRIRFPSRSSNWSNDTRTTEINGTGTTLSGCESDLVMRLIDGRIDMFNITPLCPSLDVEA